MSDGSTRSTSNIGSKEQNDYGFWDDEKESLEIFLGKCFFEKLRIQGLIKEESYFVLWETHPYDPGHLTGSQNISRVTFLSSSIAF